jgi:hypothetical protein
MSLKQIIGGYMPGTNSVRNHPIKNIIIQPNGWTKFILEVNGKTFDFENKNNNELVFDMHDDNSYKIGLYVNNNQIYQNTYIFHYTLNFIGEFNESCITYKEDIIYDS